MLILSLLQWNNLPPKEAFLVAEVNGNILPVHLGDDGVRPHIPANSIWKGGTQPAMKN
jgi:hypothetical protein